MKFLDQIPKSLTGKNYGRNADGKIGFNSTLYEKLEQLEDYDGSYKFGKRANSLAVGNKTVRNSPRSGYQDGMAKGSSFATVFDKREYFENHIRKDNNRLFGPEMRALRDKRNNATFIFQSENNNEDFDSKVKRHLDNIMKEEEVKMGKASFN